MPQGTPCPGILDKMDAKDWPRRQGYSARCLDGYCQVHYFIEIAYYPRLHAISLLYIRSYHEIYKRVKYSVCLNSTGT